MRRLLGYPRMGACLWGFGNLGGKRTHTGAEQPFDTVVDGLAPGEAPQPLTLNHPASNPGCSSGWGSFFLGAPERGQDDPWPQLIQPTAILSPQDLHNSG